MQDAAGVVIVKTIDLEPGAAARPQAERRTFLQDFLIVDRLVGVGEVALGIIIIAGDHVVGCMDETVFSRRAFIGDDPAGFIHAEIADGQVHVDEVIEVGFVCNAWQWNAAERQDGQYFICRYSPRLFFLVWQGMVV